MLFLSEPNDFYLERSLLFLSSVFRTHVKKLGPVASAYSLLTEELEMGCGEVSLGLSGQPL